MVLMIADLVHMTELLKILENLGLAEYVDVFSSEGFETWDTLVDITEADLEHLNVKLGHRRKLQRAISDYHSERGGSSQHNGVLRQPAQDNGMPLLVGLRSSDDTQSASTPTPPTRTKRKYRRHPKPDANAPERAVSAYVIFSNDQRVELKDREMSFTQMAKTVGERWRVLPAEQRDAYERRSQATKDRYNRQMAEYQRTPEYHQYKRYVADFKAKTGHQPQGIRFQNELGARHELTRTSPPEPPKRTRVEMEEGGDTTVSSYSSADAMHPMARARRASSGQRSSTSYFATSDSQLSAISPASTPVASASPRDMYAPVGPLGADMGSSSADRAPLTLDRMPGAPRRSPTYSFDNGVEISAHAAALRGPPSPKPMGFGQTYRSYDPSAVENAGHYQGGLPSNTVLQLPALGRPLETAGKRLAANGPEPPIDEEFRKRRVLPAPIPAVPRGDYPATGSISNVPSFPDRVL